MTYPANLLADRIRAALMVPQKPVFGGSPADLIRAAVAHLMKEERSEKQAIAALARKGEGYGNRGQMGGLTICYFHGENVIEWAQSFADVSCTLGMILAEVESGVLRVPPWFKAEWMFVPNGKGGYSTAKELAQRV